ncbi:MAG: ParB/RepB/Spo0J family partition protein [Erysipelotrichaceae bacterium]|nr:ParB/RepB/Spo0J family partition protein [Erysipelotrichaceae bacterium]MDD3809646.1 ParB/RepB/Spo0J family partition protein [Erysipelotrichaceae bacterium]
MRIKNIEVRNIRYQEKQYSPALKESIERIGLSFMIKVNETDGGYECVDGHKRLAVLNELQVEYVNVVVLNDGSSRSNDCGKGRNSH